MAFLMNNLGKICVSVSAPTAVELINQIDAAALVADIIEIRFDGLNVVEIPLFFDAFKRSSYKNQFLATFRPADQGGRRELTLDERRAFWRDSKAIEIADLVDLEFDIDTSDCWKAKKVIRSQHDFDGVPENLDAVYERLRSQNPGIIKIAFQTNDIVDLIPVFRLLEKAKKDGQQIIPIAMGESGKLTRILGLAHGAPMTYASLGSSNATAPGQVSAADLVNIYRAKSLDENTEVYGILGSNTAVSMSPYIHNTAFAFHGLNKVFIPLQTNDLDAFMKRMVKPATREIDLNFRGFSVTIPHKQSIIKHLDALDETAEKIGAVNTVRIDDDGKLTGFNTDAPGFIEPLLNSYGELNGAKVAMLGAGGAARACVYALRKHGAEVTVFARNIDKAKTLAEEFDADFAEFGNSEMSFGDFDILVNSTPLGMTGKGDGLTPATAEQLKNLHLVYDLVYVPFQTPLMAEADKAEVPKIGGFAMLIAQALEQQRIWTGLEPPMKEMSRAALKRLK